MDKCITKLMNERKLDITSIMKLALYMLSSHMSRPDVRKMSIREEKVELEPRVLSGFPKFAAFAVERSPSRRKQSHRRKTVSREACA